VVAQKFQKLLMFGGNAPLLWPVIIKKSIVQQNRIKSVHHNGNPLKIRYYYYYYYYSYEFTVCNIYNFIVNRL